MKKFFTYPLACLLALTYAISTVGVSVYNCHCSHSRQIVWLADNDCECAHAHYHHGESSCHDAHNACCNHSEEEDSDEPGIADHCCSIVVETLKTDQEVPLLIQNAFTEKDSYISFAYSSVIARVIIPPIVQMVFYNTSPPLPVNGKHSYLSATGQWRL